MTASIAESFDRSQELTMNRIFRTTIAALMFALTLAGVPTRAQQSDVMKITVPFAFSVGNTTLEAGTYRVLRPFGTPGTYQLRNVDSGDTAAVTSPATIQDETPGRAKLVFHVYGGEYFLSQIWMPASSAGTELAASRQERRLAKSTDARQIALIAQN